METMKDSKMFFRISLPVQELSNQAGWFAEEEAAENTSHRSLSNSSILAVARNLVWACSLDSHMEPSGVLWVPESWPQRTNSAQCPFSRYQMYVICFLLSLPVVYQAFQKILEPKRTSVNIWSNCLAHGEMEVKKGQMLGSKVKIKKK